LLNANLSNGIALNNKEEMKVKKMKKLRGPPHLIKNQPNP
jgi:hypothetical protein